jgi:hypothetical protein
VATFPVAIPQTEDFKINLTEERFEILMASRRFVAGEKGRGGVFFTERDEGDPWVVFGALFKIRNVNMTISKESNFFHF